MLGKLTSFITNSFLNARRTKTPKIELYSCESLSYAKARLAKGGCPHCDPMTGFEPMGTDEQSNSFEMCRNCGQVVAYDSANKLIGTAGFVNAQYSLYLDKLAREEIKRTDLIAARKRSAYQRYETAQVANHPIADKVMQEVEQMGARDALSAYRADKAGTDNLRKAA